MPQISLIRFSVLAAIVGAVFFYELGGARLWDRDEPRNARASHEMLERGDWVVPTFNGELRDHKPILLYWAQMSCYALFGESEFSARLPSALAAVLTILAVAVLASRLSGRAQGGLNRDGFWAAAALSTCLFFVMAGRAATPDACLIAFSTLGIAALVLASTCPAPPYATGRVGKARWLPAAFGYTMLGLAALAKGPVGIILPLTVVHVWWMVCRRLESASLEATPTNRQPNSPPTRGMIRALPLEVWRTFNPFRCIEAVWSLRAIPGILLCLTAAVPWYLAVGLETDGAFLRGFFLEHNVGRALNSMEGHNGSIFFYPVAFLAGIFPWSLWFIPMLIWCRKAIRENVVQRQMIVLAATWISVYVCTFTAASTKLPSYITPCYAGAALVIGSYLRQFESSWNLPTPRWRMAAYSLTIAVGAAIACAVWWLSGQEKIPALQLVAICGLVIAAAGAMGFWWEQKQVAHRIPATWLTAAAIFQCVLFGFGATTVDGHRKDLGLLAEVKSQDASAKWLSIGGMEPSWVHYLDQQIVEVTDHVRDPASWQNVESFLRENPDGNVIAVGDEANQRVSEFGSKYGFTVQKVSDEERFLRPGKLAVYRFQPLESFHEQVADRVGAEDSGPSVSARPVGYVRPVPEDVQLEEDLAEPKPSDVAAEERIETEPEYKANAMRNAGQDRTGVVNPLRK